MFVHHHGNRSIIDDMPIPVSLLVTCPHLKIVRSWLSSKRDIEIFDDSPNYFHELITLFDGLNLFSKNRRTGYVTCR